MMGHVQPKNKYPLVNIHKTMEHHYFKWVNQLFLWQFSIAMLNYQRVDKFCPTSMAMFKSITFKHVEMIFPSWLVIALRDKVKCLGV